MLKPGDVLEGRYVVEGSLGEGAMASVFRVRHLALGSQHAVKVLNPELAAIAQLRERFLAEGRIQAQLRHPNIVPVTDLVTEGAAGLIMELVEGGTLEELIANEAGRLDVATICTIMAPILDAVGEAHHHGVVHRDLKPSNILLGRTRHGHPRPMVADFGIAKVLTSQLQASRSATKTGVRVGTPLYMSPEQIVNITQIDHRTDIFALGAILYEMIVGHAAFDDDNEFGIMSRIVAGKHHPIPDKRPGASPELERCLKRAMATKPEDRYPSCDEFLAELTRAPKVATGRKPEGRQNENSEAWFGSEFEAIPEPSEEQARIARRDAAYAARKSAAAEDEEIAPADHSGFVLFFFWIPLGLIILAVLVSLFTSC